MQRAWWSRLSWGAAGLGLSLLGAWLIAQRGLDAQRAAFETDARIVHRLLSQQVVQHDAVLATLALLEPARAYFTRYENLHFYRDEQGILEVRMHTDGGPFVFTGKTHREFPDAFYDISRDRDNRVVILTGTQGKRI